MSKQAILDVLNSINIVEKGDGEDFYLLVENTKENRRKLNNVGISNDLIDNYGDHRLEIL